ncbi:MAG: hypothetical protein WD994_00850 [Pseudomonadales bacterium]
MSKLLVTGFTPFDGRKVNASWIAAQALAKVPECLTLRLPVVWGEPQKRLEAACSAACPEMIVSLGEGREGWFDIETVAKNTRKERADNNGKQPSGIPISSEGPAELKATLDAGALLPELLEAGFPVRISGDAGGFLCEETLYTLELLKLRNQALKTVAFVHLPPYGTRLHYQGIDAICNEELLSDFARVLIRSIRKIHHCAHE